MPDYNHSNFEQLSNCVLDHLCFQDASFDDLYYGLDLTAIAAPDKTKLQLLCSLESLIEREFVTAFLQHGKAHYRVTESGFNQWQDLRKPDWNRFIHTQTRLDKQYQVEYWNIKAKTKEVILDFIEIHQSLGLLAKCPIRLNEKSVRLSHHNQVRGYECSFQSHHTQKAVANSRIEELRSWWSSAADLTLSSQLNR